MSELVKRYSFFYKTQKMILHTHWQTETFQGNYCVFHFLSLFLQRRKLITYENLVYECRAATMLSAGIGLCVNHDRLCAAAYEICRSVHRLRGPRPCVRGRQRALRLRAAGSHRTQSRLGLVFGLSLFRFAFSGICPHPSERNRLRRPG